MYVNACPVPGRVPGYRVRIPANNWLAADNTHRLSELSNYSKTKKRFWFVTCEVLPPRNVYLRRKDDDREKHSSERHRKR